MAHMDDIVTTTVCEAIQHNNLFAHEEFVRKKGPYFPFTYLDSSKDLLQDVTFSFILDRLYKRPVPGQTSPSAPPLVTYHVRLMPYDRPDRMATINFWKQPETGLDIKCEIERELEIPSSTISLYYQNKRVLSSTMLSSVGLADKDTIEIGYHSEGDIDEVQIGFCWFEFISRLLAGQHPSVWIGLSSELEYFIAAGLREDLPQRLARCLYGESRRSVANREYFNQLEGMRVVSKVHNMLTLDDWRCLPFIFKFVEIGCVNVLASLTYVQSPLRANLIQYNINGHVARSLIRAEVTPGSKITDSTKGQGRQEHRDLLMVELVQACLTFMTRIYESSELQKDIIENTVLFEQLVYLLHSPSLTSVEARGILCIIGAALWSRENKEWIIRKPSLLRLIIESGIARRKIQGEDEKDLIMFEFYLQILLSSIVHAEAYNISRLLHHKLLRVLESFLSRISSPDEFLHDSFWTFSPFGTHPFCLSLQILYPVEDRSVMKLVYYRESLYDIKRIHGLGMESIFFTLRVLVKVNPKEALERARMYSLVDYFVCLPNNIPPRLKGKAKEIIKMSFGDEPVTVPRLEGIVRAFLAKSYFGLQGVKMKKIEDIQAAIGPPPPVTESDQPLPAFYILKVTG